MKLLHFCLCLLAISFQAIFASSSSAGSASLKSKRSGGSKTKKPVGKLVWKKKLSGAKRNVPEDIEIDKRGKSKDVVIMKSCILKLSDLLPKALVEIVISYFTDNLYHFIVSTHNWTFKDEVAVAVDSARLYVLTRSESIKGLDHSLANVKDDERHLIEFGDPKWSDYSQFSSSHDGRHVSFSHEHEASAGQGEHANRSTKWLIKDKESEERRFKCVAFDGEDLGQGVLSQDGQTLYVYDKIDPNTFITRA